jgi:hypothetical protein
MADNNSDTTDHGLTNSRVHAISDSPRSEENVDWSSRLWADSWEGETGLFGDTHLCVATKKWGTAPSTSLSPTTLMPNAAHPPLTHTATETA